MSDASGRGSATRADSPLEEEAVPLDPQILPSDEVVGGGRNPHGPNAVPPMTGTKPKVVSRTRSVLGQGIEQQDAEAVAAQDKKLEDSKQKRGGEPREIQFAITVMQLQDIADAHQVYTLTFYLQLKWKEDCGENFTPYLEWRNATTWENKSDDVKRVDLGNGLNEVTRRSTITATFAERLELEHFPFDYQKLHVKLVSDSINNLKFVPLRNPPGKIDDKGVGMVPHWKLDVDVDGANVSVDFGETAAKDSASGEQYCQIMIRLFAVRIAGNYLYNVFLPAFLMTMVGLTQFGVPVDNLADRQSINLALLLTVVGLKFSVASELPRLPYTTVLDNYLLIVIAFLCFLALQSFVVREFSKRSSFEPEVIADIDETMFWLMFTLFVSHQLHFFASYYARTKMIASRDWTRERWGAQVYRKKHRNSDILWLLHSWGWRRISTDPVHPVSDEISPPNSPHSRLHP